MAIILEVSALELPKDAKSLSRLFSAVNLAYLTIHSVHNRLVCEQPVFSITVNPINFEVSLKWRRDDTSHYLYSVMRIATSTLMEKGFLGESGHILFQDIPVILQELGVLPDTHAIEESAGLIIKQEGES